MKTKSRNRIKHAVLVLVALAGLSFSLAAAGDARGPDRSTRTLLL